MQNGPVLLFDGVCNLCNGTVNFIIRHDKEAVFKFASLQSEAAEKLLQQHGVLKKFESVILIDNGVVYQKSGAVLQVLKVLPWYWKWTQFFWMLPSFIRDAVYDVIAKNRYKWFGKNEVCMPPTPEVKERFLADPEP